MIEMVNLKEHIILDTYDNFHVAFSIRGSGILAKALLGRHDRNFLEGRRTALEFASQVVRAIGFSSVQERLPTPQILVDAADAVITDPKAMLICTTWKWLPEGIELCSIGTNTVLVFQEDTGRQVIAPHTACELFKSEGRPLPPIHGGTAHVPLKALESKKNPDGGTVEDVRVAVVPLHATTTIAVIEDVNLAEDIIQEQVLRQELSSFIESWDGKAKKVRTSVLISL